MNEIATTTITTQLQTSEDFTQVAKTYLSTCGQNVPQNKVTEFLEIAKTLQLNPFKREVYLVGYKDKFNIITGYEVYLKRAERTGKLDGWNYELAGSIKFTQNGCLDPSSDMRAKITIYRKDWEHPFSHVVYINECIQTKADGTVNSMWKKMPSLMLRKVAIGQGFRLAFPDELGGMPYVAEEMPQDEINISNKATVEDSVETVQTVESGFIPQNQTPSQNALELDALLQSYAGDIHPQHGRACVEALKAGDETIITEMLGRLKTYLQKKGLQV